MAGPDGLLQDPERGVALESQSASDKDKGNSEIRSASTQPSSREEDRTESADGVGASSSSHPLAEKLQAHVPPAVRKRSRTVWTYLKGPEPPRIWKIRPFLPRLQHLPLLLVDKLCPQQWQQILALFVFYVCWIATFAAVLHKSSAAGTVPGYGQPILIQCGSTFWYVWQMPIV